MLRCQSATVTCRVIVSAQTSAFILQGTSSRWYHCFCDGRLGEDDGLWAGDRRHLTATTAIYQPNDSQSEGDTFVRERHGTCALTTTTE